MRLKNFRSTPAFHTPDATKTYGPLYAEVLDRRCRGHAPVDVATGREDGARVQ